MLDKLKTEWRAFKQAPRGRRFVQHHERYQARNAPLLSSLLLFLAVFSAGGTVLYALLLMPLPALVLAALAVVLLPGESRWFARLMDRLDVWLAGRRQRRPSEHAAAAAQAGTIDAGPDAASQADAGGLEAPQPTAAGSRPAPRHQHVIWMPPRRPDSAAPGAPPQRAAEPQRPDVLMTPPAARAERIHEASRPDAVVRARVVPPREARALETIKMWTADDPAPQGAPVQVIQTPTPRGKTIVVFPPPVQVASRQDTKRTATQ